MNDASVSRLTSQKLLIRNTILSFSTQGLPVIIAFFTIPLIIKGLGNERFGILTLIWAVIGYSSLLDFGMGHALTQLISRKLGAGDTKDLQTIIWTTLLIMLMLGISAGCLIYGLTPLIVDNILKIPAKYRLETLYSVHLLAFSLPLLIMNFSLNGILEAHQKFHIITAIRLPIIFCNYVAPLIVLAFYNSLFSVVLVLVAARVITFFAYLIVCMKIVVGFNDIKFKFSHIRPLLSFSSWVTVTNIINPLMVSMDRFFISNILSAAFIVYYTTPHEVITKLWIIPNAIMSVMFPAFSAEFVNNKERTLRLYFNSLKFTAILMLPLIILTIIFAKIGLSIWLNPEFAEKSYKIAQILAVGVFIYGLNQPSFNLIQATGRSDITAKLHLIELPLYLVLLCLLIRWHGLIGAAIAWLARIFIDAIVLNQIAIRLVKSKKE